MIHAVYTGEQAKLRGCKALLLPDGETTFDSIGRRRPLQLGCVMAQFTNTRDGLPECLQKGGPKPTSDDVRYGWHPFPKRDFKIDDPPQELSDRRPHPRDRHTVLRHTRKPRPIGEAEGSQEAPPILPPNAPPGR